MKITGILGSERKGGNTNVMLDAALEEAQFLSIRFNSG